MSSSFCGIFMSIRMSAHLTARTTDQLSRTRSVNSNERRYRHTSINAPLVTLRSILHSSGEQRPNESHVMTMANIMISQRAAVVLYCPTKSSLRSLTSALAAKVLPFRVAILILLRRFTWLGQNRPLALTVRKSVRQTSDLLGTRTKPRQRRRLKSGDLSLTRHLDRLLTPPSH